MTRGRLARFFLGPEDDGGFGQGFATDLQWSNRLRRARRRDDVAWRAPTRDEIRWWNEHPVFGPFGDLCRAVATVDGRRWAVLDRDWHGWPDPPQFVWFALEEGDSLWAAGDFDHWPKAWGPLPPITTTPPP